MWHLSYCGNFTCKAEVEGVKGNVVFLQRGLSATIYSVNYFVSDTCIITC